MNALAKIFDLVDAVVVITVDGEGDRQRQVAQLLKCNGVDFEFFSGADFRQQKVEELISARIYEPSQKLLDQQPLLTPGEIGCAVSHRGVAERVIASKFGAVLVLEDDVTLIEKNLRAFGTALDGVPDCWNLIYLGYNKNNLSIPLSVRLKLVSWHPVRYCLGSQKHDPSTIRRIYRRRYNTHWSKAGCFNGAHAYVIDTKAAKYLVNLQTPVKFAADVALNHLVRFSNLKSYCLHKDIFDQRWDIPSLIGDRPSWQ